MKESVIVKKIIAAVRAKYPRAYVRKISDRFTRGLPDILIVVKTDVCDVEEYHGTLLVEVKNEKGVLSKLQRKELVSVIDAGGKFIVARSVEDVLIQLGDMGAIQ